MLLRERELLHLVASLPEHRRVLHCFAGHVWRRILANGLGLALHDNDLGFVEASFEVFFRCEAGGRLGEAIRCSAVLKLLLLRSDSLQEFSRLFPFVGSI